MADINELACAERADLAEFLRSLTPQQWQVPSLCAGWTVRGIVAHLLSYEELSAGALLRRFARGGLRLSSRGLRLIATDLDWTSGRGPDIRGPGEALLMAMAGRRGVAEELDGHGLDVLRARIG